MSAQPAPELVAQLGSYLDPGRVQHSMGVAEAAVELAERFAPELKQQALLAGLLHDNAKGLDSKELMKLAAQHDIEPSAVERANPALLHGKVGAALLKQRFGVNDQEVVQAVVDHVTGRPGMGMLSQILYVADQAAPDRTFNGVDELRETAKTDLRMAVLLAARHKIAHTVKKGLLLEPNTVALYNELTAERARG